MRKRPSPEQVGAIVLVSLYVVFAAFAAIVMLLSNDAPLLSRVTALCVILPFCLFYAYALYVIGKKGFSS